MKKNKLKIFVAAFIIVLGLTTVAPVLAEPAPVQTNNIVSTLPTRMPTSKKALAIKFFMAMMGVGASSVIIYVLLSVYNRFIYGSPDRKQEVSQDDEFKTPNNMKDALSIFLKKTK